MYEFGTVVLVPFPFTNLKSAKVRPALVISRNSLPGDDIVLCFISSQGKSRSKFALPLKAGSDTGLKVSSVVCFDKIVTLSKKVIIGELGRIDEEYLQKHKKKFEGVFEF